MPLLAMIVRLVAIRERFAIRIFITDSARSPWRRAARCLSTSPATEYFLRRHFLQSNLPSSFVSTADFVRPILTVWRGISVISRVHITASAYPTRPVIAHRRKPTV